MANSEYIGGIGSLIESQTDVATSQTEVFSAPLIDVSLGKSVQYNVRPLSENDNGPYEFRIPGEANLYIDASTFRLRGSISLKIQKAGATLGAAPTWESVNEENFGLCNMAPASLFRTAEVWINDKCMSYVHAPMLAQKTFIETVLSFGEEAAATHLKAAGFYMDGSNENADTFSNHSYAASANNKGFVRRKKRIMGGKVMEFSMPLHLDMLQTERLFLPRIDLKIVFLRNPDAFTIMSDATSKDLKYVLAVKDLMLTFSKTSINPTIHEKIQKNLSAGNRALYPLSRTVMKKQNLPWGQRDSRLYNMFQGELPCSIIMTLMKSDNFVGTVGTNPFEFLQQ